MESNGNHLSMMDRATTETATAGSILAPNPNNLFGVNRTNVRPTYPCASIYRAHGPLSSRASMSIRCPEVAVACASSQRLGVMRSEHQILR